MTINGGRMVQVQRMMKTITRCSVSTPLRSLSSLSSSAAPSTSLLTYSYRAPKTIRPIPSSSLPVNVCSSSAVRSFWGRSKPDPSTETEKESAAEKENSEQQQQTTQQNNQNEQQQSSANSSYTNAEYATPSPPPPSSFSLSSLRALLSSFRSSLTLSWSRVKTYSVWLGVGVGVMFVFKLGLNMVEYFATINFLDVGEVAFMAGLLSGVGIVGCAALGTRFLRLRPEPIYQHAMKRITADPTVAAYMGQQINAGSFRAYSFLNGSVRMTAEQREKAVQQTGIYKYWQPKRLQM